MSVIQGTANWAHIIKPNFKFKEEGEWSIDVCNLDEKNTEYSSERWADLLRIMMQS